MKKIVLIILMFICFIGSVSANEKEKVKFSKCVDGDTAKFIIDKKEETFRFLAIDTPESTNKIEPYGKEASKYTCDKLTNAKSIEIEFDPNSNELDKYGRYLVWVYVDNQLLQDDIIRNGYAEVAYLYGDYLYTEKLQKSEKLAKEEKLNIWSDYEEEDNTAFYILLLAILIILFILGKKFGFKIVKKSDIKKIVKKI